MIPFTDFRNIYFRNSVCKVCIFPAGEWDPSHWRDTQGGGQYSEGAADVCMPGVLSHCTPCDSRQ